MNNVIQKIIEHQEIDSIFNYAITKLYTDGPISTTVLEILSYLYIYENETFQKYSNQILKYMGVHYKNVPVNSLTDVIFGMYKRYIKTTYNISIDKL